MLSHSIMGNVGHSILGASLTLHIKYLGNLFFSVKIFFGLFRAIISRQESCGVDRKQE